MKEQSHSAARYGVIGGFALATIGVLFRVGDISVGSPLATIFYLFLPAIAWFVVVDVRRNSATVAFNDLFRAGSIATIVTSAIYACSVLLYNQFIDASLLADVRTYLHESAVDAGKSGAALETINRLAETFTQPVIFELTVFLQLAAVGASTALGFAMYERWRRQRTGRA